MDLLLMMEGRRFTLFSLLIGDSVPAFLAYMKTENQMEFDRMNRRLEQLAERGASRRRDEFNHLGDGLYEAKTKGGGRVIFFYDRNNIVICAAGFSKQSRRTPKQVLDTARSRRTAYEKHKRANGVFNIQVPESRKIPERRP